ncbi:MAG: monovalent cation/H+ antiporter complex subunit F [Candidatus Cloacimonadaceae bacterium]|nr:monovalent cation/H+ antiporter complex subunit F [Candidatus Cloacimonadaceae bacterium]MDP3113429.1 monovalent cation/H+ antiporter complex subunit F [Candidatus Cloacimonadaceae bacterium]
MIEVLLYILMGLNFLCFIRVLYGPTMADRMVAIDIFGILVVGICALLVIKTGRLFLIDVAIAWIILSFIGTIALAKYLTRKKLDE